MSLSYEFLKNLRLRFWCSSGKPNDDLIRRNSVTAYIYSTVVGHIGIDEGLSAMESPNDALRCLRYRSTIFDVVWIGRY